MFFKTAKELPSDLTSYDLLKSLAVILMIVDHIGAYLLPDQTWWRTASSSLPIWFFFVGYANSRNLTAPIWVGAGILIMVKMIFGWEIFPLSILATIIFARIMIDPIMKVAMKNAEMLIIVTFALTMLWLPTRVFFEYGTLAFLIAMYGWLVRHQHESQAIKATLPNFMGYVLMVFGASHFILMDFTPAQTGVFWASLLAIFTMTLLFKPITFPNLTYKLPRIAVSFIQIMGRYSLYIYVMHIAVFLAIAWYMEVNEREIFAWHWFSQK